ncbi:lactate racemase domain-containing protein [Tissierellaceae bacterium HCP3S3_D8]
MEFEKKIDIDDIRLNLVSQKFNTFKIEDVRDEVFRELDRLNAKDLITPNMKIAITAGSRGISNIPIIMKAICDYIKDAGADPFIVPSMGSHGGATAEGQRHVLTELGITEESMGCPILSNMDVVKLGETDKKVPVYMDKNAYSADGIVVVNRIKPHTDFNSDTESGLLKMIAVGLGNAKGCATMHSYGLRTSIPATAKVSMKAVNIMFGLGIVENSRDETYKLKALLPEDFEREEKELLKEAKEIVPKLPTDFLDLLIVKEMGKMISGTGMDTKVIGRIRILGEVEPEKPVIKKLVILNLSEASYGNALGVGLADITTKKLVESIDFEATYANTISTTFLERGKIPITMPTDKEAIQIGLNTVGELDAETVKVGIIENTLDLQRLYLSDAVLKDIDESKIEVLKRDIKFLFDEDGNLII